MLLEKNIFLRLLFPVVFMLLCNVHLCLFAQPAPGSLPWENPNSGFDNTSSSGNSGSKGSDKIETVITTSGGSRENGKLISNSGTEEQKSFVNDFLNNAAEKIKNANGGYGWVWTWQKKWKIGPDGKPFEVKEEWQQGKIGTIGHPDENSNGGRETATPSKPSSSGGSISPSTTKASPAPVNQPINTGSSSPGSLSRAPGVNSKSSTYPSNISNPPSSNPPQIRENHPSPGVEVAPPRLPPAEVQLVIQNPVDQRENTYPKNVFPDQNLPIIPLVDKCSPIPEDTRVKITLDFNKDKIREDDLTLIVTDNEGDHEVPKDEMRSYRHIFRVPDMDRYSVRVQYKHPITGENKEIIRVTIPVYPLDFKNRSIDSGQHRSFNDDSTSGIHSIGKTGFSQGKGIQNVAASNYVGVRYDSSSNSEGGGVIGEGSKTDLTDLYADPMNSMVVSTGSMSSNSDETSNLNSPNSANAAFDTAGSNGPSEGINRQLLSSEMAKVGNGNQSIHKASHYGTIHESDRTNIDTALSGSNVSTSHTQNKLNSSSSFSPKGAVMNDSHSTSTGGVGRASSEEPRNDLGYGNNFQNDGIDNTTNKSIEAADNTMMASAQASSAKFGTTSDGKTTSDRPYILSLSVKNPITKLAQSFDFISDPYPTAGTITKNTNLTFSLDFSREVDRNSVNIVIFDGSQKTQIPLSSINGDVFEHLFAYPTAEAYIWIYGNTTKAPFSYKLSIPVADL